MAQIPSPNNYNDLLRKLNAMGAGNYRAIQDPKFHDRVTIQDTTSKKKMTLNLTSESADSGRVWLVGSDSGKQQKIITPRITADRQGEVGMNYESDTAQIKYQATSSTGMLAGMIFQSFNRADRGGGDPKGYFRSFVTQGNEDLGFRPAPDVPRGHESTRRIAINQIDFRATSGGGRANPDEYQEIIQDFRSQQANALTRGFPHNEIVNDTIKNDQNQDVSYDSRPITLEYLNRNVYQPNEKSRLEPTWNTGASAVQANGMWYLNTKPKTIAKSNKLSSGSDPATPYQMRGSNENLRNRLPVPMMGQPITNTNRPALALSNALMPDEDRARSYERQNYVFDNMPVPGAAIAYHDPNQVKADFWGTESNVNVKVPALNYKKLTSGEQKLEIAQGYQSKTHGGGKEQSVLGSLTTGDKTEDVRGRFGPGIWRSTGSHALTLPSYVNPTSGEWSSEQKEGYVETEGLQGQLQKALPGMALSYGRVASPTLTFAGANESSTSMKGLQIKASEMFTGLEQTTNGQNVTRFTGELKGNAFLHGYFGGLNYNQLRGLARSWEKRAPGMGAQIHSYLKENYGGAAKQGRELNIDYNQMATDLGYQGGGGGQGMLNEWFSGTIMAAKPGSGQNRNNVKRYGAGYASGWMQLGVVHGDQLEHMRDNYRRANPNLEPAAADTAFNKTFRMQEHGADEQGRPLYLGSQKLSKGAMFVSMLNARRIENVHGPRMTQDWIQAVTKKYPDFAKAIGANIDTFQPQGATQSAAAGIMKYATWQGQNRDDISANAADTGERPSNYAEISDDRLSDIQAHLSSLSAEKSSPVDKLRSVVDRYFPESKDSSADALLYNKTSRQYLPNPRAILNSTFSELGVEAAGLARPMVDMLSKLGGIVGDEELSDEQKVRQSLNAGAPLQKAAEGLITGSGNFMKRLLGTNIKSAVSGRTGGALNLANDEAHMDFNMALMSAKQMGFKEQRAVAKAREIMQSGASYVSARQPMGTGEVESRNLIKEDVYAKERFASSEAYENVRRNPLARGQIDMPYSQATSEQGDFDRDPISGALGLNRVGNELKTIEDPRVHADVMTAEKIKSLEEGIFPDEGMRNMVNANVKSLTDFAEGKAVVGEALAQKKAYSPQEVLSASWDKLMNKTLGMGVGYNPRRAVGGAMASSGYSAQEMANVMSSMPGLYQPALDTALTGREATGVRAASIIARPYFHSGYEKTDDEGNKLPKQRLLRVAMTGERPRKDTRMPMLDEEGKQVGWRILPKGQSPNIDVDIDRMLSGGSPQELLRFGNFVAEGFAGGYKLGGKQVGMSAKQYAGWFAAPGDSEELEKQLGEDTRQWSGVVTEYQRKLYRSVRDEGGTHIAGVEKVLSTSVPMSILTRASSKAVNQYDPVTGEERIEGAKETYDLLTANTSSDFVNRLTTAQASHDVEHREKGMNLRGLYPRNLRTAAETMGQGVKGSAMRMLARISDVAFGPAAVKEARKPDPVAYEKKTLQAKVQAAPPVDDAMQNILDTMAAHVDSGAQGPAPLSEEQRSVLDTLAEENPDVGKSEPDLFEQKRAAAQETENLLKGTSTPSPASGGGGKKGGGDVNDIAGTLGEEPDGQPAKGTPQQRKQSNRAATQIQRVNEATAARTGHFVRAVHARTMQYQENAPSGVDYMDKLLTGMGYRPGFLTKKGEQYAPRAGDVHDRMQRAYIEKKGDFLSQISPEMQKQLLGMEGMQKDTALALYQSSTAPGLGLSGGQIESDISAAVHPTQSKLGQDIFAFSSFKKMVGDDKVKNPYTLGSATDLAEDPAFQALHKDLSPLAGMRGGTRKNLGAIRNVLAEHPQSIEMLMQAKGMGGESVGTLPPEVAQMSRIAASLGKVDPGLLKAGGSVTKMTTEEIDKVSEAFKKATGTAKDLREAVEGHTKASKSQLEYEAQRAKAASDKQIYGSLREDAESRVNAIIDKTRERGGTMTTTDKKAWRSAMSDFERFGKKENEAYETSQGLEERKDAGKWGMFARRALGGFGLMYARSVWNLATSGLGYGMDQRNALEQNIAQGGYQSTGEANVPFNQQQQIANRTALMGTNNNPVSGLQYMFAGQPMARDLYTMGAAGIGAWGATQFAADQLKGRPGAFLSKASPWIGIGAAVLSTLGDVQSRAQDVGGLSYRAAQSAGPGGGATGMNDAWAVGMLKMNNPEGYAKFTEGFAESKAMKTAFEQNMSLEQERKLKLVDRDNVFSNQGIATYAMKSGNQRYALAGDVQSRSDEYAGLTRQLLARNPNFSPEATAQAAGFLMRNPGTGLGDDRVQKITTDYQFGGWGAQTSQQALAGLGYSANDMFARKAGSEFDRQSGLQMRFATGTYDEQQKARMTSGIQMLGQMQGGQYIEGVGKYSKSEISDAKIEKFIDALGRIADSNAGETFVSEQNASFAARRAGMAYKAPNISDFMDANGNAIQMTEVQAQARQSAAQATMASANQRIATAQGFAQNQMNLGNNALATSGYNFLMGGERGDQWRRQRAINADPLMLANMAAGGVNLSGAPTVRNIQGREFDASYLANADISNQGRVTGLPWATSGLQRGSISAEQVGQNIFGSMNNIGTRAMVQGVKLPQPIKMADGTMVSSVGGQLGLRVQGNQLEDAYQEKQMGMQNAAMGRDYAYQMKMWGLQDQQRALGHGHQMAQFGFQEQGMQLQEQGIQMQNKFFWQGAGLQQKQTQMTRGWTREDWGYQDMTRNMQWGWKQEDYQEESRFMTGRQRKLADRQQKRDTVMHNLEGDQIEKGRGRQNELWKLEDERFTMQKQQHTESIAMQMKQLELQRQQFEEGKKFYLENKKIEDEIIKLQRAHWLEEHKASKEQLALTQEHQKAMLELKKASDQFAVAETLINGEMNTLVDDSLTKFQQWIVQTAELLAPYLTGGGSNIGTLLATTNSANTQTSSSFYQQYYGGGSAPTTTTVVKPAKRGKAEGGSTYESSFNVIKTGEKGWEYIVNGEVIPHEQSKEMESAGIMPGSASAQALAFLRGKDTEPSSSQAAPQFIPFSQPAAQSTQPQVINVYVGSEKLASMVVDIVSKELKA